MIEYKSNKFDVKNDEAFQAFCGNWEAEFLPPYHPDSRVGFILYRKTPLPEVFWEELGNHIKRKWTAIVMDSSLTMIGFNLFIHLLNDTGVHERITRACIKFKKTLSDKKKRRYLGLPDPDKVVKVQTKEIEVNTSTKPVIKHIEVVN